MAKLGAVREGVIRADRITWTGHVRDTVLFSILAGEWKARMEPDNLLFQVATWLIPLVFAIVLHEISHGWVANAFGDPTAREKGRLSLNPIRHVDPIGTVVLPLVLAVSGAPVFGWAKPVPVVARRMRNPRLHMMLVALAGPGMNLALALARRARPRAAARGWQPDDGLGWAARSISTWSTSSSINIFLAVFNLLPIPPFDGGHVVEGLLPPRARRALCAAAAASAFRC